jgi:hypothetical protein
MNSNGGSNCRPAAASHEGRAPVRGVLGQVILIALVRWGARRYQPPPAPVEPLDIYDPLGIHRRDK